MLKTEGSLFEEFQCKGMWWLPQKPDERVPGTLFYKPGEAIRLELSGAFRDFGSPIISPLHRPGAILGVIEGGKDCTLYEPIQSGSRRSRAGVSSSSFISHQLYVGKHFQSKNDIRFTSMIVQMTYLDEWAGHEALKVDSLDEGVCKITVPYYSRSIFTVRVESRNASVSVRSNWGLSYSSVEAHCKHFVDIHIIPDDPQENEWFDIFQRDYSDLLTLFIGNAVYPCNITAFGGDVEIAPGRMTKETVNVYTSQLNPRRRERVSSHDMPVPLAAIKNDVGGFIEKWFANSEKLKPVYTLLTATYYNRQMYVESEFLTLMQAIETFHRRELGGKYLAESDYEEYYAEMVKALPSSTPSDLKERLKQYLRHGNELSLRKRIVQLTDGLSADTRKKIAENIDEFVEKLVATRNYLTHYEKQKGEVIKSIEEYFHMNAKLTAILSLLLLKRIGLREEEIAERIFRHAFYPHI